VTHGDLQPGLGGKPGQLGLPCPDPVAVGPADIRTHQQPIRLRIAATADLLPPTPQGGDRERRGVMVGPNTDPAAVVAKVVDPVGDRLAHLRVGEVMDVDLLGFARGLPLGAPPAKRPPSSFFVASTLTTGCPAASCV
jgi:hypothetical protein